MIRILLISFLISGCSHFKTWQHQSLGPNDTKTLFLVSHGWHTGLVLPLEALGSELSFLVNDLGKRPFYEIGWGDKGFYESRDITVGLAIQAIFWPTESVVHAVALPSRPDKYFYQSEVVEFKVSSTGLNALRESLLASFKPGDDSPPSKTQKGLYGRSYFYEGNGKYFMTNTCNTWTARMLEQAGLPVSSFLTLTASSVVRQTKAAIEKYSCCEDYETQSNGH